MVSLKLFKSKWKIDEKRASDNQKYWDNEYVPLVEEIPSCLEVIAYSKMVCTFPEYLYGDIRKPNNIYRRRKVGTSLYDEEYEIFRTSDFERV